jgi:NAD+ kinase
MKFGITAHPGFPEAIETAAFIADFLKTQNIEFYVCKKIAQKINFAEKSVDIQELDVDILICIGGDGTILRVLQDAPPSVKIFGIHVGLFGFLTEIEPNRKIITDCISRLLKNDYTLDERIKLKTILNGKRLVDCTNEAVVHTAQVAKMRHFKIFLNGRLAQDVRADGIIIATPTGSTSYAMSVGGPILDTNLKGLVISPMAPFKLSARSIVVPANSKIGVEFGDMKEKKCLLVLDGQREYTVTANDKIEFTISENTAKFVRFDYDFYRKLGEKLKL